MHVAVKSDIPDGQGLDSDGEICDRLVDTEPLQHICETENQVARVPKYKTNRGLIAQSLLTAVVTIGTAGAGMPIGYSAVLLPQLQSVNESLQADEEMGSWIASIHSAATPIGSFLSGTLIDFLGRKLTLQISCIPLICGWVFISLSGNHALLLVGRVLAGMAVGLMAAPGQVYVAEISDPSVRGVFSSIPFASYAFGILLVYMLGSTTHWRLVAGLSVILPTVAMIMYFFLPESPVWLVRHGYIEKAQKACLWLRGGNVIEANQEIQQLINRTENEKLQKEKHSQLIWKSFFSPQVLKPFIIVNIFSFLQTFSGVYLFVFYAVEIISHMGGENINEFFAAVLTAGVRFIFTVIASVLLAFVGRRSIGLGSALGTGISALCLSMFLYSDCKSNSYFAAICLLFYVAANTVGLLVLPGVMIGEMFPVRVRGLAGSLTFTFFNLSVFGTAKIFPLLKRILGIHGFFLLFGTASLLAGLFIYCAVPETKGKSLNEIEDYFLQDNLMWVTRNRKSKNICKTNGLKV
ncbi:hypothetical protein ILUMI_04219 [Ignelater luminosus]|uniref:Major facilitator superfamily (MFS) profile domain-containing protein n=1 Tax=Ignelater luminosus TaxID=2038154 RepID=A0A8K0D9D2_IGNLU|nr:hypothetical protein ILUMI_04219 [Ignelater luminosus]